ncbi:MAG: thiol peroxidase (atypical 2-Cys peroxiredoxin) [Moraxellaceae bacterium]|nr:thiol peroxidase (atypical 2-Cys peroxiredoxin) [Moraxellaceae bacterium]
MGHITLKGNPVDTSGDLPAVGSRAPDFTLVRTDLGEVHLRDFEGRRVVLNIFPSVDTPTCAMSVRKFNEEASNSLRNTVVLCVSADLPFALSRFCGAEGLQNVIAGSVFRSPAFGRDYGVLITSGPLAGLLSRAVVVVDENGKVLYTEQVPEIADEPDYQAALDALKYQVSDAGNLGPSS